VASVEPHLGNALEVLRAQAQLQDAARSLNSALHHTELDPIGWPSWTAAWMWMSLARRYRRAAARAARAAAKLA
jgi:DNA repair protein RecN (Recombination protein N)